MNTTCDDKPDVLVVGGGMAGAMAALTATQAGLKTCLARRGWGATALSSGGLDLTAVSSWLSWVLKRESNPDQIISDAVVEFQSWMAQVDYAFAGQAQGELILANALGTIKRTQLAPEAIQAGNLKSAAGARLLFIGFPGYTGVNVEHLSRSMRFFSQQGLLPTLEAEAVEVPLPTAKRSTNLDGFDLAQLLDDPQVVMDLAIELRQRVNLGRFTHLAFPPVLGLHRSRNTHARLQAETSLPCFEVLSVPPSVPGFRLQRAIDQALLQANVRVLQATVQSFTARQGQIVEVLLGHKEARYRLSPKVVILATGKFIGGGIERNEQLRETAFDLPVHVDGGRDPAVGMEALLNTRFTAEQPIFSAGLRLDSQLRPVASSGEVVYTNLLAAGSVAEGYDVTQGNGGLGLPLVSGYLCARLACAQIGA